MRTIKFRTKSLEGELIYFELHETYLFMDPEVFYVEGISCESGTEQQFTGIENKEGEEIYEGDVVIEIFKLTGHKTDSYTGPVVWWDCGWFIDTEEYGYISLTDGSDGIEIIGNIYENPELIKQSK